MELNDLLRQHDVDPTRTLVLRHRPTDSAFRKVLPLLGGERLDLFDAYQAYQGEAVEHSIRERTGGWVVSFIAYGAGRAVYVGTYRVAGARSVTRDEFRSVSANNELRALGNPGWPDSEDREARLLFDLPRTDILADWRGKLVVQWPPPERGWYRRAHRNIMPVIAILEESWFSGAVPAWDEIDLSWAELRVLPQRIRAALEQWRGIYLIWDASDGQAYVGSAYGSANILGRWETYAASGHGGNKHLRKRSPDTFRFTILQRTSPDLEDADVIRLESSWKARLHTRFSHGLNDN